MSAKSKGDGPNVFDGLRAIRKAAGLTPPAKMLLWAIYDRAGNGKGECTASATTLAADQGLTGPNATRRVYTWMQKLKCDGWIVGEVKAHHPRPRVTMGPTFRAAAMAEMRPKRPPDDDLELGRNHHSSDDGNSDDFGRELGRKAPATRMISAENSDEIVRQTTPRTTPETSQLNDTRSLTPSVVRSGDDGASERGDGVCVEEEARKAWSNVWKDMAPPESESWAWRQEGRRIAQMVAFDRGKIAPHVKPAAKLVETRPAMLTAGGVSWWSVAAAIIRVSEIEPTSIRKLPEYINGVARDFEGGTEIEPYARTLIENTRRSDEVYAQVEKECWRADALEQALGRHVPAAARAMTAIRLLERDREFRLGYRAAAYCVLGEFVNRVRGLSDVYGEADWIRLASVAEEATVLGADDLPTLDDLLNRAEGRPDGELEAVG